MLLTIGLLSLNVVVFTLIFFFLDDSHFSGINSIRTLLKDEILRKKVEDVVEDVEEFERIEPFQNLLKDMSNDTQFKIQNTPPNSDEKIGKIIVEEKEHIESKVTNMALGKINHLGKLFDRFYFSVVTGTTLGYGDIYPDSRLTKVLVIIELIISISIVLFL